VSPWLSKELRVVLCPEQVTLAPVRRSLTLRGVRRTFQEPQMMSLGGTAAAQPWRAALLALETELPVAAAKGRTTATVVLSNQFLRYALVPWQAGLTDAQEDLSYTRHCFTKVYGKAALQWEVRLSHQASGRPRLASGVDAELLKGLRSMFARSGIALRSIQPHLMAAFNNARSQLRRRSTWLALLEPGHLCLALLRDGYWSRVRSLRIDSSWRQELPRILEREAFLVDDAAVPHDVYVGHLDAGELVLPEVEDWQFHALKPTLAGGSVSPEPGHVAAMAMTG
jgi:hypothetical protein